MPEGILTAEVIIVKKICETKTNSIPYDSLSINDLLECFRIVTNYILSEKKGGYKVNKTKTDAFATVNDGGKDGIRTY